MQDIINNQADNIASNNSAGYGYTHQERREENTNAHLIFLSRKRGISE